MTLDATQPAAGTAVISGLDDRIRENRVVINANTALIADQAWALIAAQITVEMTAGQTTLIVGNHVNDLTLESVLLTAAAAVDFAHITGARAGQVKVLIFGDANVTVKTDAAKFKLNSSTDLTVQAGDILALMNVGGDGAGTDGYWVELFRTLYSV